MTLVRTCHVSCEVTSALAVCSGLLTVTPAWLTLVFWFCVLSLSLFKCNIICLFMFCIFVMYLTFFLSLFPFSSFHLSFFFFFFSHRFSCLLFCASSICPSFFSSFILSVHLSFLLSFILPSFFFFSLQNFRFLPMFFVFATLPLSLHIFFFPSFILFTDYLLTAYF